MNVLVTVMHITMMVVNTIISILNEIFTRAPSPTHCFVWLFLSFYSLVYWTYLLITLDYMVWFVLEVARHLS